MNNPQPAVRVDAREAAIDICERWLRAFAGIEIKHTPAHEYAEDAVRDILDAIRALTPAPTEAGGVGEAAVDLLSHLKLHVMDKLGSDDADALHDCMLDLTAALACLKPGSRFTVDGVECVVVRKDALDWLNGEGDSFERPDNVRGNFWWRGEFRRRAMLRACEEKS